MNVHKDVNKIYNKSTLKKSKILRKARAFFWERGFDNTSIGDIASACGFEPGNIYNYFSSKEQLLYEVLVTEMESLLSAINQHQENDRNSAVERLRHLIRVHTIFVLNGNPGSSKLLRSLSPRHRKSVIKLRDTYDNILFEIIRSGINSGDFVTTDIKIACYNIAAMISRSRVWFSPKGRLTASQVADFMVEFALAALGAKQITDGLHSERNTDQAPVTLPVFTS